MNYEFNQRYAGKYFGKYRGVVAAIDDPQSKGRIRVEVRHVYGVDFVTNDSPISGWALPMLGGSSDSGFFSVPPIGSMVWVEFEQGDIERPLWMPGAWSSVGGENNVPRHAKGHYDDQDNHATNTDVLPPSQFTGEYSSVRTIRTPGGHCVEFDDKDGEERLLISHKNGARIEILNDGSVHHITTGNKTEIITGSDNKTVGGATNITTKAPVVEKNEQSRKISDDSLEHIVINGATYTYNSRTINSNNDELNVNGSRIIQVMGEHSTVAGGNVSVAAGGKYEQVITETANWIIANAASDLTRGVKMHLINGKMQLMVGLDPTGMGNAGLTASLLPLLEHGGSDVILKAMKVLSLRAPFTAIGPTPGVAGKETVVLSARLSAFFNTHVHPTADGSPTLPPVLPMIPPAVGATTVFAI